MKQQLVCNNTYKCTKKDFHDSFQQQQQLYHIPTKFMCIGLSPLNVASFSFLGPILSFKLPHHSWVHSLSGTLPFPPRFKYVHSPSPIFLFKKINFNMRVMHVSVSTLPSTVIRELQSASHSPQLVILCWETSLYLVYNEEYIFD